AHLLPDGPRRPIEARKGRIGTPRFVEFPYRAHPVVRRVQFRSRLERLARRFPDRRFASRRHRVGRLHVSPPPPPLTPPSFVPRGPSPTGISAAGVVAAVAAETCSGMLWGVDVTSAGGA